jgi:hypothetical protein
VIATKAAENEFAAFGNNVPSGATVGKR